VIASILWQFQVLLSCSVEAISSLNKDGWTVCFSYSWVDHNYDLTGMMNLSLFVVETDITTTCFRGQSRTSDSVIDPDVQ